MQVDIIWKVCILSFWTPIESFLLCFTINHLQATKILSKNKAYLINLQTCFICIEFLDFLTQGFPTFFPLRMKMKLPESYSCFILLVQCIYIQPARVVHPPKIYASMRPSASS